MSKSLTEHLAPGAPNEKEILGKQQDRTERPGSENGSLTEGSLGIEDEGLRSDEDIRMEDKDSYHLSAQEVKINILQKVLSTPRSLAITNRDPGPPPDGGLQAWLQAVQAHLCIFNSMGYISSYGLFEAYYLSPSSAPIYSPHLNSSNWTWPPSLEIFLLLFMATVSGRLYDAGYYRMLLMGGFVLQFLGVFSTSFARNYTQVMLSQGLAQGLGNGFMLCPSVSNLSTYFVRKRALAISIMACGSATGGIVFPLLSQQLLPRIGFAWTVRVMGFVMLFNMAIILTLARSRIPPRKSGPAVEWGAFREGPYVLFVAGMFCIYLGLYFAFSYVSFCSPFSDLSLETLLMRSLTDQSLR
jgi:hypothetical protein